MTPYIDLDETLDEDAILEESIDTMATAFPGWEANAGNLDYWLLQIVARLAATVFAQEGYVSEQIFHRFGEEIVGVAPITATSSTVDSTWTAIDNAGYTIPAGTSVAIPASGSVSYAFVTTEEVTIPAGSTATAAGEVALSAVTPGEEANGLTDDPVLQDAYAWVSTITLVGTTSGGVDAESDDEYLDRLRDTLTLLTLTPVIPADVEILARSVAGVDRAVAIDGYDSVGLTYNNDRTVHVVVVDEDGAALSSGVKDEVDDLLQDRREVNFVFTVGDPTSNTVNVVADVHPRTGWASATVLANVETALSDYLNPANWGRPEFGDPSTNGGWVNRTTVRRNELISLIDQVEGVDYVNSVYAGTGTKSLTGVAATDVITSTAHGYSDGDRIVFTALTGGTGLSVDTVYFVRDSATNTYKVAATAGGTAINFTTDISAGTSAKVSASDVSLTGVAPLTTPGALVTTSS